MSTTDTTSPVAPEVRLFLARVRHELADLDADEVVEMTDGLEADLTELVAERGAGALGSPVEYAGELRAAAGLGVRASAPGATTPSRRAVGDAVDGVFDAVRRRADDLLDRLPRDVRPALAWARPLWWVARAWAALQLAAAAFSGLTGIGYYLFEGGSTELVPSGGAWGWVAFAVAVAVSVQVGRGRLWPGGRRAPVARVVLLVLNAVAVVAVPYLALLLGTGDDAFERGYSAGYGAGQSTGTDEGGRAPISEQAGIYSSGHWVSNIYPYDASGKPLVGVQLYDQTGQPLEVVPAPECPDGEGGWSVVTPTSDPCYGDETTPETDARVPYPWTNGAAQVENVFPMALRMQRELTRSETAFSQPDPPRIGQLPLASVPPVSLPGITPSVQEAAAPPAR